jgi:hypothetical protein
MKELLNLTSNQESRRRGRDPETGLTGRTGESRRAHDWTHTHSFYALMGGFAFSTADLPAEEKFLPRGRERVVLTGDALEFVARERPFLIPDMPEEDIIDKSKANGFDKTVVCAQATWFIAQLLIRLGAKLPISLLELSTAAHSLCALLIYLLWWQKPFGIEKPTVIEGKDMHVICAWFCKYSEFDGIDEHGLSWRGEGNKDFQPVLCVKHEHTFDPSNPLVYPSMNESAVPGRFRLYQGQSISGFNLARLNGTYLLDNMILNPARGEVGELGILSLRRHYIEYDLYDLRRWTLSYQGHCVWNLYTGLAVNPLVDRLGEFSGEFTLSEGSSLREHRSVILFLVFSFAGLVYGGIHLTAWAAPFRSATQLLLWRMSGLVIAGSGLGVAFLLVAATIMHFMDKIRFSIVRRSPFLQRFFNFPCNVLTNISFYLLIFSVCVLYLFARAYLVIECFLSLPYSPTDIFKQPEWTSYFPHIG